LHYVPNFHYPSGGREIFVSGLISELQSFDVEQCVVTTSDSKRKEISALGSRTKVFSLPVMRIGGYPILRGLPSTIRDIDYDIINIHGYGEYSGDVVCILKRIGKIKVPMVLTTHGIAGLKHAFMAMNLRLPLSMKQRILRLPHIVYDLTLGRLEMNVFDRIIVHSEEEIAYLKKIGLNSIKSAKVPIGINSVFFAPLESHKKDYVLYVGRIDAYKGLETLLLALKILKSENTNIRCIIIGKDFGYKDELCSKIKELALSDLVDVKEFVCQDKLVQVYHSALVTILPSSSEGFPLTIIESMATGTPFLATPVGVIPELVESSNAGLLIPVSDAKSLSQAIKQLYHDCSLWDLMSRNGRKYASQFTIKEIARKYYDMYSSLVDIS
jgi:glycosyltransferase involved in cell wall biosynthesis